MGQILYAICFGWPSTVVENGVCVFILLGGEGKSRVIIFYNAQTLYELTFGAINKVLWTHSHP